MEIVVAEIFSAIVIFCVLIGSSFLPFSLISCRRQPASPVKEHPTSKKKWSGVPLLSLCNCFAAGVFIATCFLGLVPHVREHVARYEQMKMNNETVSDGMHSNNNSPAADVSHKMSKSMPWTEVLLIGGFLLILLVEELIQVCQRCECKIRRKSSKSSKKLIENSSKKHFEDQPLITAGEFRNDDTEDVEKVVLQDISSPKRHCHDHHDPSTILKDGHSLDWRSIALLIGLGIHGAFEGIALGLQETSESLFSLMIGVMTHEVLCAIAFGINLAGHKVKIGIGFLTIVMFSLSIPLGMVAGIIIRQHQSNSAGGLLAKIVLEGLAAGTFVYIAFIDMLNHELSTNNCRLAKVLCVIFGFLLFFVLTFFS